jgi:hypothetical protein
MTHPLYIAGDLGAGSGRVFLAGVRQEQARRYAGIESPYVN